MPLFGPPYVTELEEKRNVKGLVKALRYQKDVEVRIQAAKALGEIGDPQAMEPLFTALKNDLRVRKAAAEALGKIGDVRSVAPLNAALRSRDKDVREAAAVALGQIGDARAADPLIDTLKRGDWDIREAVAQALVEIGAPAVQTLSAALEHEYQGVRETAARALGQIGDVRAVDPLIAALRDKDPLIRTTAARALGQIGDAHAVEALMAALRDSNSFVRKAASESLERLGWQPDKSEAGAAYWVEKRQWGKCIETGTPAVMPLIAALKEGKAEDRRIAADTLVEIGATAVEPLIDLLGSKEQEVRRTGAKALVNLYHSGILDDEHKRSILAVRDKVIQPHHDQSDGGSEWSCDFHYDFPSHTDRAPIDFPL